MTELPDTDAFLDALAFSRCTLRHDWEGRNAVARACDPVALVDALTTLYLGLIATVVGPNALRIDGYLDIMREQVPTTLKADE